MCDLIDLNSPDLRKLKTSKLASPLIPAPVTPHNEPEKMFSMDCVCHEKRSSFDNNPFDQAFKETVEYAAKKDDPFEAVLQKALQSQNHNNKYKEDYTPKRRKHREILKMNKTMDEPLREVMLNKNLCELIKSSRNTDTKQSIINNSNNTDLIDDSPIGMNTPNVIICPPSPTNNSVLNHSAMNDTLSEISESSEEKEKNSGILKTVPISFENQVTENGRGTDNLNVLAPITRRSLSQGNQISPETPATNQMIFPQRSHSVTDMLKTNGMRRSESLTSATSRSNSDCINVGFLEVGSTATSESFDISRISANRKTSNNSYGFSTSLYSYGSANKAFFLDGQSSGCISGDSPPLKLSLRELSTSRTSNAAQYLMKTPLQTPDQIEDLQLNFERLKLQSFGNIGRLPVDTPNSKVQHFLQCDGNPGNRTSITGPNNDQEGGINLVDIRAALPGEEHYIRQARLISASSSDSVFIEDDKVNQSILQEARLLARTFDEMAQQVTSSSFSSTDDLLYNGTQMNFDCLPVSDDDYGNEVSEHNLIDFHVSPTSRTDTSNPNEAPGEALKEHVADSNACKETPDKLKNLETEFIDQDITENKIMAATLLLDLEKLIHRENNPEAISLLESLEKVLGVKYESNTQLLATCLQTNNLSKSPIKCGSRLGPNENIKQETLERSHEDNYDIGPLENVKILNIHNDEKFELNLNIDNTITKSEKSIITDFTPISENEEKIRSDQSNVSSNNSVNKGNETTVNHTEALKLITNLSQILGGCNNESSPLSLLTNLRQVLNLATNQLNFENAQLSKLQGQESFNGVNPEIYKSQVMPKTNSKIDDVQHDAKLQSVKIRRSNSIDSAVKKPRTSSDLGKRSMSISGSQHKILLKRPGSTESIKPRVKSVGKMSAAISIPKSDAPDKSTSAVPETGNKRASMVGSIAKYKLKKKTEPDGVSGKKGPLKALIPIGNMRRQGSLGSKVSPMPAPKTPPKCSSNGRSTFTGATSSTPNSIILPIAKSSPKVKPVASSTPDGGASKNQRSRMQAAKSRKFSCNISPVPQVPVRSNNGNSGSKSSPAKSKWNKTLSPPKRRSSQEAHSLNTTESGIPKYSANSISNEFAKPKVPGSPKALSAKSETPKKQHSNHNKSESQIPQSPLKTMNNQNAKFKPFNLISKLRRGNSGGSLADKENCM